MKKETQKVIQVEPLDMAKIVVFIPNELKKQFKRVAFMHDMSMTKAVRKLIEEYVEDNPIIIKRRGLRKPRTKGGK